MGCLEKFCILFAFSMSYCIYVTLAPCSIVHDYLALICVQVVYMCAIVLKIHILPSCCFYIQHTQCICCIFCIVMTQYLWCLVFLVPDFVMCRHLGCLLCYHPVQYLEHLSPLQTVVYCFPNLAGPHQMLHSLH